MKAGRAHEAGDELVLAVDVGGTKTHAALGAFEGDRFLKQRETKCSTAGIADLGVFLREFSDQELYRLVGVAVGIAGPVIGGRVRGANLPWEVDASAISRTLGGLEVRLLNDLVASGYGIEGLDAAEVVTLHDGVEGRIGNRALVSPGTGLGEAILFWDGTQHVPVPSEAGHGDFAPRTEEEVELLRFLREKFGRASAERVLSGPGLVNVYVWLRTAGKYTESQQIDARLADGSAAQEIAEYALAGTSPRCVEALRLWCEALAAEAGNVALRGLATGGVYFGGGIPAKVLPFLRAPQTLEAFFQKFPQEHLLREIPIRVILSPETSLRGAANVARAIGRSETRRVRVQP